jgi:Zn ribbon nucleic-acid-binding protein
MSHKLTMGEDITVPESRCTACGHLMNAANVVSEDGQGIPEPGDITVCIQCGHLMAFGDELRLRDLTDEEAKEIVGDERILIIKKARDLALKEHPELKDSKQ